MLALVLFWAFGAKAQGLIWSGPNHTTSIGNTIGGGPLASWQIAFDHVPALGSSTPPSLNPVSGIFIMSLSTNDSGRTFFVNALNEPGFAGFVAGLTDGANNYIRFQSYGGWQSGLEQSYLGRSALAPDLAGYDITQIGFRVNSFYDYYDGTEDRYFKNLDYSLDFYGVVVPEPSTYALLTLGAAKSAQAAFGTAKVTSRKGAVLTIDNSPRANESSRKAKSSKRLHAATACAAPPHGALEAAGSGIHLAY